jgi:hypothetical protein
MIDLDFTEDGDLFLDSNKRLKIINDDYNEILIKTIKNRIQSANRDWDNDKIYALSLDDFQGERLTNDIIQYMKYQMYQILTADGLLNINEVLVLTSPFIDKFLNFTIVVNRKDKYGNDLIINFGYDMRMNKIMPRFINPKESLGWQE